MGRGADVELTGGTAVRVAVVATMLVTAPVVAVAAMRAGRDWLPVGDFAVIDLRIRDVWSSDLPMVGAYSRYGWNHPGPWLFWATAPLGWAFGAAPWTTVVGFAALQGVAIAWLARLCWTVGRLPLVAFGLAIVGLWFGTTGAAIVLEPWNPNVAVPFFILFVLQAWLLATGDRRRLPGAIVTASLLVQAHVGYLPLVVAAAVVAAACLAADRRAHRAAAEPWRAPVRWALGLATLLWLPPVIEEIRRFPLGNLSTVARYVVGGEGAERATGIRAGAGVFAASFKVLPPWIGEATRVDAVTGAAQPVALWWWLVPVLAGMLGLLAVRRTRNVGDTRLLLVTVSLVLVGALSVAGVRGELLPYLIYWSVPSSVLFLAACARAVARASGWLDQAGTRTLIVGALVLSAVLPSLGLAREVWSAAPQSDARATDAAAILRQLPSPTEPTIVRYAGVPLEGLQASIFDQLDRDHAPVRADIGEGFHWGYGRELLQADAHEVWYAVEQGPYATLLDDLPGSRVAASITPLSAQDEAELVELERRMSQHLVAAGRPDLVPTMSGDLFALSAAHVPGIDAVAAHRIGELNQRVTASGHCRCAVVAFPSGSAPTDVAHPLDPPSVGRH